MRLLDWALERCWMLEVSVMLNAARVLDAHARGVTVTAETVAQIVAARRPDVLQDVKAAAGDGAVWENKGGYQLIDGIAVLAIGGLLMKGAGQINGSSQPRGTSVESIRKSLAAAAADNGAFAILLVIDSPGGSVMGMANLADEIYQIDQKVKPVYAFCDDLCCSGGYYMASQARAVYAAPSSVVGSIGVYTVLVDDSRAAEAEGLRMHLVSAGKYKGGGAEGVPITDDYKGQVQREIDAFYLEFTGRVARGRAAAGLSEADVLELADGRVHVGKQALDNGLVDGIKPLSSVMDDIRKKHVKGRAGPSLGNGGGPGSPAAPGPGVRAPDAGVSGTIAGAAGQEIVMDPTTVAGAAGGTSAPGNGGAAGGNPAVAGTITADQANAFRAEGAQAEARRVAGISAVAARFAHLPKVQAAAAAAIADSKVTVEAFDKKVIDAVAEAARPLGVVGLSVGENGFDRQAAHITTALVHRQSPGLRELFSGGGGVADRMANRLGYEAKAGLPAAAVALAEFREAERSGLTRMRLVDVVRAAVAARDPEAARAVGFDDIELFRMAMGMGTRGGPLAAGSHTTSDFPSILANVANKTLLARFEEEATSWELWCAEGTATDYKDATMVSLSDAQDLKLILEGDFAKKVSFNERKATIAVQPYGLRFGMTYQMMRNDDLNAFTAIPALFGAAARRLPEILVYILLESGSGLGPVMPYDSVRLIDDTAHHNSDGAVALSYASAQKAVTKMRSQVGFGVDKTILNIKPSYLIVPPALEFTAGLIFKNVYEPGSSAQTNANLLQGLMAPVVVSRLAASATRWWVAGPKNNSSIEVRFLDGQRTPRIDTITNGNPLEQEFQVSLMGVGAAARNHENIYGNAGQ